MTDDHSDTTDAADSTTDAAAFTGGGAGEQTIEEQFLDFFASVHADDISLFAQQFPDEMLFEIDWADLHTFDPELAQDWLDHPNLMRQYAEEALGMYDLPEPVPLEQATVALVNLPETHERLPGETRIEDRGEPIAVTGQVAKTTKVKPKLQEAAFECQRCGTLSYVDQSRGFTEPHECQGCERQGPFDINFDESDFINSQLARISEPPEQTGAGTGRTIDVTMEGNDLVERIDAGDRTEPAPEATHLRDEQPVGQQRGNSQREEKRGSVDGGAVAPDSAEPAGQTRSRRPRRDQHGQDPSRGPPGAANDRVDGLEGVAALFEVVDDDRGHDERGREEGPLLVQPLAEGDAVGQRQREQQAREGERGDDRRAGAAGRVEQGAHLADEAGQGGVVRVGA
jgi:predicted RNA-binding Zn-ribbon protein involved in translation (DUF1610 family)